MRFDNNSANILSTQFEKHVEFFWESIKIWYFLISKKETYRASYLILVNKRKIVHMYTYHNIN
jgi:hypothetical protein